MKTIGQGAVATAVLATIAGVLLGSVVAVAMGRNGHLYLRFVGLLLVAAVVAIVVWAYQTYLRPKGAHVEEAEVDTTP